MGKQNSGYMKGVDELIAETPFERVAAHYGLPSPRPDTSEYRMACVFNEACHESQYGHLTVNLTDPARLIYCHSCRVRGNLLTLLHGLEHRAPPSGGRLRGEEFKAAVRKLRAIQEGDVSNQTPSVEPAKVDAQSAPRDSPQVNPPLKRHPKEAARSLVNLYEDLVSDPSEMPPNAAAYFRSRPWLTEDVCRKWGVGYLPRNGRSLLRGWIVYTQRNERGDVISYSGRDAAFDEKLQKWIRSGRPEGRKPNKHRYVSGYHRGLELYGQRASRMSEPEIKQSLSEIGLVIVEGANDVIRLDSRGVAAVGLCSNRATDEQVEKLVRFATRTSDRRVILLPDRDEEGEVGFRELLWTLNERGLEARLGWSRTMHADTIAGRQPEDITDEDWTRLTSFF